jgi:anaerobic dimethyl sulfoxide reductase subunit B (iron-sulfur subunit)
MQHAFYFDQTRCIGCYTCVVACKDWHDVPAGPSSWRRIVTVENGKFPDLFVAFLSTSCHHCANPPCVAACPVGAITKREEDGIVVVDRELCLGRDACHLCGETCPYDAPQFGAEEDAKMQKCDLCQDRLVEGKLPICVAGCPMRALDAGPIEELRKKYCSTQEAAGFDYSSNAQPSVVFKPKQSPFKS